MAVSREATNFYYRGNVNSARSMIPFCLKQLNVFKTAFATPVWFKSFTFPNNSGTGKIYFHHGVASIYIDVTGGEHEFIEEYKKTYKQLDLLVDAVRCFNHLGKSIDCTYENRCYGKAKDPSRCSVERLFKYYTTAKNEGYTAEPFSVVEANGEEFFPNRFDDQERAINYLCNPANASSIHCLKSWSKTVDNYTAICVLFYSLDYEINMWAVVIEKDGKHIPFKAGRLEFPWWPYPGAVDFVQVGGVDPFNTTPIYKAFDLWKETTGQGIQSETKYYLSTLVDPEQKIDVWCLNYSDKTMKLESVGISWIDEFVEENNLHYPYVNDGWEVRHIRVCGLVKRTGYWAMIDCTYGSPDSQTDANYVYWENDKEKGKTLVAGGCGFQFALLNEFTEELIYVPRIRCQECEEVDGIIIYEPDMYRYAINCYNWDCSEKNDCNGSGVIGTVGTCCTLTHEGVEFEIPNFTSVSYCLHVPDCGWYPEYGQPGAYLICTGTHTTGPPHLGSFGMVYSYVEFGDEGEDCKQYGYVKGMKYSRHSDGGFYSCWNGCPGYLSRYVVRPDSSCGGTWNCHCNGACDPCGRCSSGYHGGRYQGYCWRIDWEEWIENTPHVVEACVLPKGIKGKFNYLARNGNLIVCYSNSTDVDTSEVELKEGFFPYGSAGDFAQGLWPYYPSYAIVKGGTACSDGGLFSEEETVKKKTGELVKYLKLDLEDQDEKCELTLGDKYSYQDNNGDIFSESDDKIDNGQFFFYSSKTTMLYYTK